MNTHEYLISFHPSLYLRNATDYDGTMQLSDEQLAGLALMLRQLVNHRLTSDDAFTKVLQIFKLPERTPIDIENDLYRRYYLGSIQDSSNLYMYLMNNTSYYPMIEKYVWNDYTKRKISRNDISKRYSILITVWGSFVKSYQFDTLEFLQGVITACQWMNADCHERILFLYEGDIKLESPGVVYSEPVVPAKKGQECFIQ